ncbi:flagella basal body P-ring formation protein FlgA [Bradyrhizobium sp. CCBAU 051011]|uniref:flagellar basal body P-ring formation chaperone FlgA n=1 Tax=Bradyrhizobium sp. CCBAU 051011 TaxID=858422 RepID=UPI001374232B|nr:flagellar basal body P-ring formation chaperone FlgA [Bradyrhizobium sp. CCBAU 051011]QHO78111.1 flagella basal body P-ring formation protein FlgA [Bradyrhizobium sp. CCBAU 051011]
MIARALLLATALIAASSAPAVAQTQDAFANRNVIVAPVLRANVQVSGDLVRIGDVIDNAGSAAQIAIYRAPDLGTTGSLPVAQVLNTLRAHHVIGVDTRDLREISVTRLARTLERKDIELQVARALERRNGLGDAANLALTFDRDPGDVRLDSGFSGSPQATIVRYDNRNGRFDVTLEITNENGTAPVKLRFTGTAIETVEAAVLTRNIERNEILKSSDVVVERRPKAEVGTDAATRDRAVGMQARRQLRAAQAIKTADLAKPDLVQRDQNVTLIYETTGIYLTMRGKALDNGTEGDVVSVMNLQSKRTVSGTVIGRGQVSITPVAARPAQTSDAASSLSPAAPVAVATVSSPVAPKAE